MKKILSVFAATALLFGFASCSSDLHDDSIKPLYIEGAMATTRTAITMIDDTTQEYEFTYNSNMSKEWGSPIAGVAFKLIKSASAWTDDFGGKQDEPIYLNINDDFVTLEARSGSNTNPGNVVIDNLIPAETYKLIVDYDAANKIVKVKVTGPAIDFPTLRIETKDGQSLSMVREGTTYKYVFTPTEDGKIEYYVTNGYLYYSTENTIDGEVAGVDVETETPSWTTFNYTAGKEYVLQVSTAYDKGSAVTMYAGINDTTILAKADVIGGWDGFAAGHKLEKVSEDTYQIDFTASASTFEFAVREKAGSWNPRWFGGIPEGKGNPATPTLMDDVEVGGAAISAVYYEKDPGLDGKNIVIKGLSKDSIYTIVIQIKDASKKEIAVSCKLKQAVVAQMPNITDYWLHSNVYSSSWDKDANGEYPKFVATANPNEYTCEFKPYSDSLEFGLSKGDAFGWVAGCGFVINALDTTVNGSVSSGGNSTITGLTAGSSYILTIKVLDVDGNATAKVSLKA